jgi:hypothetical protein
VGGSTFWELLHVPDVNSPFASVKHGSAEHPSMSRHPEAPSPENPALGQAPHEELSPTSVQNAATVPGNVEDTQHPPLLSAHTETTLHPE